MSYRDLRNFTEMLRCLGYPRLVSIENFRTPNFDLVAELLLWLVQRYEPGAPLPTDTDTEQDRVIFIKSVAQFVATKAHLRLNTKRLYMADGYAVKEMLKVTTLLHNAVKATSSVEDGSGGGDHNMSSFDIATKLQDLKSVRSLASEVTQRGAQLFHLLSREPELREARINALAQPLDIDSIEKGLRASIKSVEGNVKKTLTQLDNVAGDEANLEAKIEKRKTELERSRKRLATLRNVRPAFMDEFERLEGELKVVYERYLVKFRNMTFLEHQMEDHDRHERAKMAENESSLKRIQTRLREEEKKAILSNDFLHDDDLDQSGDSEDDLVDNERSRPQNPARPHAGVRRGMYVGESDESLSGSEDDITDDIIMEDGIPHDDEQEEDDDDF